MTGPTDASCQSSKYVVRRPSHGRPWTGPDPVAVRTLPPGTGHRVTRRGRDTDGTLSETRHGIRHADRLADNARTVAPQHEPDRSYRVILAPAACNCSTAYEPTQRPALVVQKRKGQRRLVPQDHTHATQAVTSRSKLDSRPLQANRVACIERSGLADDLCTMRQERVPQP